MAKIFYIQRYNCRFIKLIVNDNLNFCDATEFINYVNHHYLIIFLHYIFIKTILVII